MDETDLTEHSINGSLREFDWVATYVHGARYQLREVRVSRAPAPWDLCTPHATSFATEDDMLHAIGATIRAVERGSEPR